MTLETHKLLDKIEAAAESLRLRQDEHRRLAAQARTLLDQHSEQLALLNRKVEIAREKLGGNWRGARPLHEPVGQVFDPPAGLPPVRHVVAADGSQIYPNRHTIAYYALVHIGTFHLQPGSGLAPEEATYPDLLYGERLQDQEQGESLEAADISRERDKQELIRLVALGAAQSGPTVALMDSPLLLWILQPDPKKELLDWFVERLETARSAGLLLAGYVDRPGSRGVADLLALASLPDEAISQDHPGLRKFKTLPDQTIFAGRLGPGQRSALFASDSPFNHKLARRHPDYEIAFFFINVGSADDTALARVETPCWVARDSVRLGQLHAALWAQCQAPGRYPYPLARAHEIAVVTQEQRQALEEMLMGSMLARHLRPELSPKQSLKEMTGG